jgi:phenylacetate-coenzyme A ligase PaaK-like adenylate-forming protein
LKNPPVSYDSIFNIKSSDDFNDLSIKIFRYQYQVNSTYRQFTDSIHVQPESVVDYRQIPFLPIEFFKTHQILADGQTAETVFYSSGTTQSNLSQHSVASLDLYDASLLNGFELAFGPLSDYCILALLPSYHENKNSSLLYMVDKLQQNSGNEGGFFLSNYTELLELIQRVKPHKKVILIGVSYALLDLAESVSPDLSDILILETGGMKGRRKEMIKADLHRYLKEKFNCQTIGSEYGMTELLSQAWSKGNGIFNCPPWMKVLTREYNDPFQLIEGKTGGINVIDLANLYSCSFIATQDLGVVYGNQFEILGRFDNADLRGCNLLVG